MREYKKPVMQVERFEAATSVADCNRQIDHSVTTYEEQTIYCAIKAGNDTIFMDNCSNNINSGKNWYFKTVDGVNYFVWYDGQVSGQPSAEGEKLISALGIPGSGWHAGKYSSVTKDYFILSE